MTIARLKRLLYLLGLCVFKRQLISFTSCGFENLPGKMVVVKLKDALTIHHTLYRSHTVAENLAAKGVPRGVGVQGKNVEGTKNETLLN